MSSGPLGVGVGTAGGEDDRPVLRVPPRRARRPGRARLLDHRLVASDHEQPFDVLEEVVSAVHRLHVLLS